ncbi:Beta-N-acetylhexosaminidase [Apiospora aurea]|uniref:Beta-N-acetylhexosaminidase n=1 Tax=Apiospora aurea TaxID=335848 RepID=A0ABR1QEC1_9PEZI
MRPPPAPARGPVPPPASARHAFGALTSTITAAKGTRLERTSGAALIIETCSGAPTKECTRSSTSPGFGRTSAAALAEHECTTTSSFAEYKCTTTTPSAELKRTTTTSPTELERTAAAASPKLRRAATAAAAASDAGCVWSYAWRTPTTSSTSTSARGCRGAPPPPPPPPPPGNRDSGYGSGVPAAAIPKPDSSRSAMLGDIQKAGGIAALKKVDRSQIRDRSAATVGGSGDTGGSGAPAAGASSGGGGMADALAAALQKRKQKVSDSDDEDNDDEW